jgi:hypothetical protein
MLLFSTKDFASQLQGTRDAALKEIASIDPDELLNTSAPTLVEYLVDKYQVEVPLLDEAAITVDQAEGSVGSVSGTWFYYFVPFDGEAPIFQSRAVTFSTRFPDGDVRDNELKLSLFIAHGGAAQIVKQRMDQELFLVKQNLHWLRRDATSYNEGLADFIRQAIERRRQRLLDDRKQVASLGYPLRRREGTQTYTAPTVRRKPRIKRPSGGRAPFQPEPALDMAEYEQILDLMANVGRAMEVSPSAFRHLNEEDLRTHFLVQLNGQYQGKASGETFNLAGKTDIIISDGGRNIFIAECKFWDGPKALTDALDQLISYTSWRDTKTAILLFNRGRQLSTVLAKIPETVLAHPRCRKRLDYASESGFRFVFQHPDDSGREMTLTILVFEVPSPAPTV